RRTLSLANNRWPVQPPALGQGLNHSIKPIMRPGEGEDRPAVDGYSHECQALQTGQPLRRIEQDAQAAASQTGGQPRCAKQRRSVRVAVWTEGMSHRAALASGMHHTIAWDYEVRAHGLGCIAR